MLPGLAARLKGKIVLLGIGNPMRGDDAIGSLLASRIKDKVPFVVFDTQTAPENYLEKVIAENPDTIVIIDAVDFGGAPGECKILEIQELHTINLFATHNHSLALLINYLQNSVSADIITLVVQPLSIAFSSALSLPIEKTLRELEEWFYGHTKKER